MAFYSDPMENEDEQDPAAPVQASGQTGTISSGAGAPGAGATTQAPQQKAPDRGSNFVGIKSYLDANKQQASQLGDQASGVINNSANDARSSVQNLNDTFNQKAGQGVALDQNALGKVNQAETLNDQEKQTLKNQYNAQYQGPAALTDLNDQYTTASQKLNTAKTNVASAGTEEGRKNLITQINQKPRTAGITNFDNALLSAGGGREKVNQAAQANQDVTGDVLAEKNTAAQAKAAEIKAQNDATRAATQAAVQGAQANLQKQFDPNDAKSKLAQAVQAALSKNNQLAQDLGDQNSLDESTMQALGLSEGQKLYDVDLNKYFKQLDPGAITKESVASQEEAARAQALAELMGGESFLGTEGIGSYNQMNPLNSAALTADLQKRQAELQPQYDALTEALNWANTDKQRWLSSTAGINAGITGNGIYENNQKFQALTNAIAQAEANRKKFEADSGFNRTVKKG